MNNYNYNLAIKKLQENGLEIISTPRHIKNGSIHILDPLTQREFTITKYGYIRTYTNNGYCGKLTYQLNPKTPKEIYLTKYPISRLVYPLQWYFMATLLLKSIKNIRKKAGK
jgi:uncharacterized membrane protein (DUF106 family)